MYRQSHDQKTSAASVSVCPVAEPWRYPCVISSPSAIAPNWKLLQLSGRLSLVRFSGTAVEALSFVAHKGRAESMGRRIALRLKDVIDRQNFEIVIQVRFN